MSEHRWPLWVGVVAAGVAVAVVATAGAAPDLSRTSAYQDLVVLFADWRAFETPPSDRARSDYRAATFERRRMELERFRVAAGGARGERLAGRTADRPRARARRDERLRLQRARPPAVGARPGVLRHGAGGAERHAGARGADTRTAWSSSGRTPSRSRRRTKRGWPASSSRSRPSSRRRART